MTEIKEIKRDGATAQKNSGRGMYQKGDAILDCFLIDYKEYNESFGVSRKVWAKVQSDAFRSGQRQPALKLVLGSEEDAQKLRLWVIGDSIFHEMLEAWKEKYGENDE